MIEFKDCSRRLLIDVFSLASCLTKYLTGQFRCSNACLFTNFTSMFIFELVTNIVYYCIIEYKTKETT